MVGMAVVAVLVALFVMAPAGSSKGQDSDASAWVAVQPPGAARELLAQGVIDGQVRVDVVAAFEGVVKSVAVEPGDTVAQGAVLLELSTSVLESQVLEAKAAALKTAQAAHEARHWKTGTAYRAALRQVTNDQQVEADARRKAADTQRLYDEGIVSRDEFRQSLLALQSARTQLINSQESVAQFEERYSASAVALAELEDAAQQAKLAKLERHLELSFVRAPIAGVVTMVGPRNPEAALGGDASAVGLKATEGALIARVVDTTKIRVVGSVVEASVGLVKAGQRARISPVSQPGLVLEGEVTRVSALPLDTASFNPFDERRTAKFQIVVEAELPKDTATKLPKLGTNAEISISLDEEVNAGLLVPLAAVQMIKPGEGVVLARRPGQSPRQVVVRLGSTTEQDVHVRGLTLEDEVYVKNTGEFSTTDADSIDPAAGEVMPHEGLRGTLRNLLGGGSSQPN